MLELLVVVGIITILAALLLPALKNAREGARSVVCKNNLKQFGTAFNLYLVDWNGWFPAYYDGKWALAISPCLTGDTWTWSERNKMFRKNPWQCPSAGNAPSPMLWWEYGNYGYNVDYIGGYAPPPGPAADCYNKGVSISQIGRPSETILMTENNSGCPYTCVCAIWGYSYSPFWGVGFRHNAGTNCLWVDGHVDWHPTMEIRNHIGWGKADSWFDRQ